MKQITFRELLNLVYDEKPPKRIIYNDREYQFTRTDYMDYEGEYISGAIGERLLLVEMENDKCITIYDDILDDKEKEYLLNIIKPFKKYVIAIKKIPIDNQERIIIRYHDYLNADEDIHGSSFGMGLPTFKQGTMYKGMEMYKEYTVEELGL